MPILPSAFSCILLLFWASPLPSSAVSLRDCSLMLALTSIWDLEDPTCARPLPHPSLPPFSLPSFSRPLEMAPRPCSVSFYSFISSQGPDTLSCSIFFFFKAPLLSIYFYLGVGQHLPRHVVKDVEQLAGASSLLPPGEPWGLNSGCPAWGEVHLPFKPPRWSGPTTFS